ncbi:hypothetical protein PENTCL1PPCAC_14761, partial [Pristionchus entomophagus]
SSVHEPGVWWTENRGVKNPIFGWWSIIFAAVCEILYVPCVFAIYIEARRLSCYRIMLWLAVVDMLALVSMSFLFGESQIYSETIPINLQESR